MSECRDVLTAYIGLKDYKCVDCGAIIKREQS
jgi:hypothetical protein